MYLGPFTHQSAGLNRTGRFMKPAREKGTDRRSEGEKGGRGELRLGDRETGRRGEKQNEPWRRITGIFEHVNFSKDERRAGLKRLAEWIDARTSSPVSSSEERKELYLSATESWKSAPESWVRVKNEGTSVESFCVDLGLTRAQLTLLLKEYCGLSASEYVDGLRIDALKEALLSQLRDAARQLWGAPGSHVWEKLGTDGRGDWETGRRGETARRGDVGRFGRSRYFQHRRQELFEESRAEERERRLAELCEMLRARRGRTGGRATSGTHVEQFRTSKCGFRTGTEDLFDLECVAIRAGFCSAARLKRACLNVLGKSLAQVESLLAAEVLQFYLCAEDRELREIASRENEIALVFRARELYHKSEDAPKEPFVDEWSKFAELKPEWLSRMREMFG